MSPLGADLLDAPPATRPDALPPPAGLQARLLCAADFPELTALRRSVAGGLADEDCYVLEPDRFVHDHLGPRGETVGLFSQGRPIAYAMLGLPDGTGADAMADALGIPAEDRRMVAHLASTMVLADWRGCGLHKWLIRHRLARSAALGRRHVVAMVSPRNLASLSNLVGRGLTIDALAPLEGDRLRYVLHRDLRAPRAGCPIGAVPVPLADLDRQRDLLAAGRRGIALRRTEAGAVLLFAAV
jgi:GNAT superfamily N-acetyltransferase